MQADFSHMDSFVPGQHAISSATFSSVFSDASSQTSDDSTSTSITDYSESTSYSYRNASRPKWSKQVHVAPSSDISTNPRRTTHTATTRSGRPPSLPKQAERKLNFVDNLVDSSTQIVEAIWPTSSVVCRDDTSNSGVLPLRTFIQETLRRSRTSYSTLQVALYYLVLIKDRLPRSDFTMEQTDDCHASRALQCGRRMFLAALILASKYLQDRNYSARAWSKISGLNTFEINQNEMAFLLAVDWNLHVPDKVYNRWTECVMKYSPSQPPSPGLGLTLQFERQCDYFKRIILHLNPDLDNLDDALSLSTSSPVPSMSPRSLSPRSIMAAVHVAPGSYDRGHCEALPTPRIFGTPSTMEPSPRSSQAAGLLAPSFGLLPTPRLTPQTSAIRDPSPPTQLPCMTSSMSLAMGTAGSVRSAMLLDQMDKWTSITSSPQNYHTVRRSSLVNSASTASSPESMISDSSLVSRSSSISSVSSLAGAPYVKLDVQARCRSARLLSERSGLTPQISEAEEYSAHASAKPWKGPTVNYQAGHTSISQHIARKHEVDDATNDAARALQQLRDNGQRSKAGSKRSRPLSIDRSGLQENVRDLLRQEASSGADTWLSVPVPQQRHKRLCCSAEAAKYSQPGWTGMEGPGMWAGILN